MREQMPYAKVLSAGYVTLGAEGFSCHGSSKALGVQAASDDARVIAAKLENAES